MRPRLKQLEIQGYKTFASRTVMEYPEEITAVVGPNGAGKSNVADAVRWVLGEQSYMLLRGRKTEDMIFSGSEQRPKASMASVSITLDNESGWLPIEYSEVSLARRAYRDGQNEYLLNGQKVRLKEINELLAQSGLAGRTYTIIGQGLVDLALSLKPEDRRKFFEEAAGIGLYRSRREESLSRLDSTRRNLERVVDILSELGPRLHSLEKQARRLQEFDQIKADLKLLLHDWYGYHWHRSQQEVTRAREQLKVHEGRLNQTRSQLNQVERKLEAGRSRLQVIRNNLNLWHSDSSSLHQQRERISRELAVLDERRRSILDQQVSLQAEQVRTDEEIRNLTERMGQYQLDSRAMETSAAEAQGELERAQRIYQERIEQRGQVETRIQSMRGKLSEQQALQAQLSARHDELTNRMGELRTAITSFETAQNQDKEAIQAASTVLEKLQSEAQDTLLESTRLEKQAVDCRKSILQIEKERQQARDSLQKIQTDKARVAAQIEVLEHAERSQDSMNQGAKLIRKKADEGHIHGIRNLISESISVPQEYERAIAAAFGEFLEGILMESPSDLEAALAVLENSEKGRAALIPMEIVADKGEPKKLSDPDILCNASDIVSIKGTTASLVRWLLGEVWIVADRAKAQKLVNKVPKSGRLVTLQGEVFWGSGIIVAGRDGRPGELARPRQRRELESKAIDLESRLSKTIKELEGLESALQEKTGIESKCKLELTEIDKSQSDLSREMQKREMEIEQSTRQLEWRTSQIEDLKKQNQTNENEIAKIDSRQDEIRISIEEFQKMVREQYTELSSLPVDEQLSQVNYWTTQFAVAQRVAEDQKTRYKEFEETLTGYRQRQEDIITRLTQTQSNLDQLDMEKLEQRKQEEGLNQSIEVLESQINPAETELASLEKAYAVHQDEQSQVQQTVTAADRFLVQSQMELVREKESLENLRHRIEDDFGLVAFEASSNYPEQTPLPLGEMVSQLPRLEELPDGLDVSINQKRSLIRRLGSVNPDAIHEYESVKQRYEFLTNQVEDLKKADMDLRKVITELDELMKQEFMKTFEAVAVEFRQLFTRLFGGGSARLIMTDEENPADSGVDIEARLPGKREQGLSLLSGGERSLTAVALIFALLKVSPTPFCVLDEVDAMLDEANVGRFCDLLHELSAKTQFIVITHNRNTVQTAGVIYGVTMGRDSTSQIISLKLDELSEEMVDK